MLACGFFHFISPTRWEERNINIPLAQTPRILRDPGGHNISIRRKLPLQILGRNLKQQVPDIHRVRRLEIQRRPRVRARAISNLRSEASRARLSSSRDGRADRRLLRSIGRHRLEGAAVAAVEALECRDDGGLLADGEGGGGAWGGAEEGARWGGDSAGCCSLDEMPGGYMSVELTFYRSPGRGYRELEWGFCGRDLHDE